MLDHHALLLFEPLLLDAGPLGQRSQERLVLVRDALAQLLNVRVAGVVMLGSFSWARVNCMARRAR